MLSLRLAQQMKKLGYDIRIIARFTEPSLVDYVRMEEPRILNFEGVEVEIISIRGWRRSLLSPVNRLRQRPKTFPLAVALYQSAFRPVLDRALEGADLVHYFGLGIEMLGYAAQASARGKQIPFVVEPAIHVGRSGHGHGDWPLYKKADLVIAHTEFEAETLRSNGIKPSHVHTLRHGFDALEPGDGTGFRRKYGIKGPIILFVGRRCEDKGYDKLLEAFAALRKDVPSATLVIAGPGEAAASSANGVIELGRVTDEVKRDIMDACTVFCMPSTGESFGMAYFEAWSRGKPVVALDLPVLRETIGASGGGLLATVDRPADLVEKLRLLLDKPAMATTMGERGREFSKNYSWERATESWLEAYSVAQKNQRDGNRENAMRENA